MEAPKDIKEMFGIDLYEIHLTKEELVDAIVVYDIKEARDTKLDFVDLLIGCYKNGTTGYNEMSIEQLKQEYIDRDLHVANEK